MENRELKSVITRYSFLRLLCLIAILSLNSTYAFSQIEINPKQLAFGTTTPQTQWVVDIIIQNKGDKKDFLLRTTFSHEYEAIYSSKTLLPDSVITVRVKFKPRGKGKFDEKIEFYFASMQEPIIFSVSADVQYLNPQDNLACPDFSRLAADCCVNNMFICEVIDAETKKPIAEAVVAIKENWTQQLKLQTNAEGKASRNIPIGYYLLVASHKDYLPSSITSYVNNKNSYFLFELQQVKNELIEERKEDEVVAIEQEDTSAQIITNSLLPENLYNPNNIVFLLDVSSSMKIGNRMQLMRGALNQLVSVLRPSDKITLISYADESKILLATITGDQKGSINQIVNGLNADGNTAGAKGFKNSYDILKQQFIEGGNNQLIVITDGAFQPEDQKQIDKLVKKSSRKKIVTSIVGVDANFYASENLKGVCAKGNGSFILIKDDADLQLIIEEIKKQSTKK